MSDEEKQDMFIKRFDAFDKLVRFIAWSMGGLIVAVALIAMTYADNVHTIKEIQQRVEKLDVDGSKALRDHLTEEQKSRQQMQSSLDKVVTNTEWLIRERGGR